MLKPRRTFATFSENPWAQGRITKPRWSVSFISEHTKAIATLDKNSLLAKHHMLHSHQIDLESVEIVDRSSTWRQRLILEAWLPNVYNNINNFQSH